MGKEEVLYIGEVKAFQHPVVMVCHGLGSCVGLFVKDRTTGICAGAHVFFPNDGKGPLDKTTNATVGLLLEKMKQLGSDLSYLRAKLVGGASCLCHRSDIGSLNIQTITDHLIQNKVFIAAKEVGGKVGRTARFSSANESLSIKVVETNQLIII